VGVTRRSTYVQGLLNVRCRLFTRDIHIKVSVISNIVSSSRLKLIVSVIPWFIVGLVCGVYPSGLFAWAACVIDSGCSLPLSPFVWSVCTINPEYLPPQSLLVLSVCPITSEYLLPSRSVWFVCTIIPEYLLPSPFVWFVCTVILEYLLETLEQEKRPSPKTLCRGPSGVLTDSVFDLLVCAL
jgi:hypothetical protein